MPEDATTVTTTATSKATPTPAGPSSESKAEGENGSLNEKDRGRDREKARGRDASPDSRKNTNGARERSRERGDDSKSDEPQRRRRRKRGWDLGPDSSKSESATPSNTDAAAQAAEVLRKQIEDAQKKQQELLKAGLIPDNPKQRELYVGNLQRGISAEMVQAFFNTSEVLKTHQAEGPPCLRVQLDSGGTFAFVEFRNPEVATAALATAGQMLLGRPVKTGRPRGYVDPSSGKVNEVAPASSSGTSSDVNKKAREIYVGNITVGVTHGMLMQLFESAVGGVAEINMNESGKYAFVEFKTPEHATKALSLDGMDLAGRKLRVGRPAGYNAGGMMPGPRLGFGAAPGFGLGMMGGVPGMHPALMANPALAAHITLQSLGIGAPTMGAPALQAALLQQFLNAQANMTNMNIAGLAGIRGLPGAVNMAATAAATAPVPMTMKAPSCEIILQNMITEKMLTDEREYKDCREDIRIECENYGDVFDVNIPKFGPDRGRVFVKFKTPEAAQKAIADLNGRKFDGNKVQASLRA
mmetsp:Transcript_10885/g.26685  ORF Transcript_10885/g.26685 Transcript_10885/m.26685 type:complete len:527 (-) Transcript_10885:296-1876(-)